MSEKRYIDMDSLTACFGSVAYFQSEAGIHCIIPNLYKYNHDLGGLHEYAFLQVQGVGECEESSLQNLADTLVPDFLGRRGWNEWLRVYHPKDSDEHILEEGCLYSMVKQDDPLHEHSSPKLLDFAFAQVWLSKDGKNRFVVAENYGARHTHFVPKNS